MDEIYTYVVTLPDGINEMIAPCSDGYTIYLSDKLDTESLRKRYEHALAHIRRRDWNKSDVQQIEEEAHGFS